MRQFNKNILTLFALALTTGSFAQLPLVDEVLENPENEPLPVHPVPHPRQIKWMRTEFYAFYHYGMDTFTGLEWGNGDEDESTYAPLQKPNPYQWLKAAKSAGMRAGIAVVKHHDGFCLWPTATTSHSIANDKVPANGKVNIALQFAKAARKLKMKYGFYVSPWDRNSALYGTDKYVTDVFLKQCSELAAYGNDQYEMWFDGANGGSGWYGGQGGTKSVDREAYYDVPNLRDTVHAVNHDCVLWGVGGEARWIGNEAGWAGETNWCTDNRMDGRDQTNAATGTEDGWMWLPGESDWKGTTGGWFYKDTEKPRSAERLFQAYLETVGRNSTFILNLPPGKTGSLPEATVNRMKELGQMLKARLGNNLAAVRGVKVTASEVRQAGKHRKYTPSNIVDGSLDTYWAAGDGTTTGWVMLELPKIKNVHYVMLQEHINLGQRVRNFKIETSTDGINWTAFGGNVPTTTIGYKRIIPQSGSTKEYGAGVEAKFVRINITDSKACPTLENVALY